MRKKIIIGLIVLLVVSMSMTFGYFVANIKTNEEIIKIGNPDVSNATLTPLYSANDVLVPKTVQTTSTNEVYYLQWQLTVEADEYLTYTLDTELPAEFQISTDRPEGTYVYNTATTYTITLELLEEVDYTEYTFYLYVRFN